MLKNNWTDLVNGESEIDANDINKIAEAVIELENKIENISDLPSAEGVGF